MRRRLPPLHSLRAFEAAARHLSFKDAAAELHVTPAAISQQVKTLEDYLRRPLFRRLPRALSLTDAGQQALPDLSAAFDLLASAAQKLAVDPGSGALTISVPLAFAARWLVPRLASFRAARPNIDVRIQATDDVIDFNRDNVDLAIRYGSGTYPDLVSVLLFPASMFPVYSPEVAAKQPIREPADLSRHTLLHHSRDDEREATRWWEMWFKAAGLEKVDWSKGPRFSNIDLALEAAKAGQGVALAVSTLVLEDLAAGRLVAPLGAEFESGSFSYFVVFPPFKADDPKVGAFKDWILAEASDFQTSNALFG